MLPHSEFSKNRNTSDGLQRYCKFHMNERVVNTYNSQRGYKCYHDAKYRAKQRGLEFSITYEDFLEKDTDTCPYLGVPIFWKNIASNVEQKRGSAPDAKSLDRVDSTKGYTYDNILIVSWRANKIKSDATYEEFSRMCDAWKVILTEHETTN